MKKNTFLLILSAIALFSVHTAAADSYEYTPYLGLDHIYNHTSAKKISFHNNALSFRIGSDYSPYFSSELFFAQSDSQKKHSFKEKRKVSYRSYGLDLLAYLPIYKFSLIATGGVGEYVYKTRLYPEKHHNEHGFGYRFGGGLKYKFDEHWQIRFICRYIKFNHIEKTNHAVEYSSGLEYHF